MLAVFLAFFWLIKISEELSVKMFYNGILAELKNGIVYNELMLKHSNHTADNISPSVDMLPKGNFTNSEHIRGDLIFLEKGIAVCRLNANRQPYYSIILAIMTIVLSTCLANYKK
jgi:hypothetical protein